MTPKFIDCVYKHARLNNDDITEQIIWTLTHIASIKADWRDRIINSPIYSEIVNILYRDKLLVGFVRVGIWFLSTCMKFKTPEPDKNISLEALKILSNYLYTNDNEVLVNCLWGVSYISEYNNIDKLQEHIFNSGVVVKILNAQYKNHLCVVPAIRILGNVLSGDYKIVDVIIIIIYLGFIITTCSRLF